MNKTNEQLASTIISYINEQMTKADIFELETTSQLNMSRTQNVLRIIKEYLNSFEFVYNFKYLTNGNILIFKNRAQKYVLNSFTFDNNIYA